MKTYLDLTLTFFFCFLEKLEVLPLFLDIRPFRSVLTEYLSVASHP